MTPTPAVLIARDLERIIRPVLSAAGVGHVLVGLSWLLTSSTAREAGVAWAGLQPHTVGTAWVVVGVVVMLGGLAPRLERVAWFLAITWPAMLSAAFGIAWAIWLLPGVAGGAHRGVATAASYALFAVLSWGLSRVSMKARQLREGVACPQS